MNHWTPRTKNGTRGTATAGSSENSVGTVSESPRSQPPVVSPFRPSPRQRRFDPSFVAPVLSGNSVASAYRTGARPTASPRNTANSSVNSSHNLSVGSGNLSVGSAFGGPQRMVSGGRQAARPTSSPRAAEAGPGSGLYAVGNAPPRPPSSGYLNMTVSPRSAAAGSLGGKSARFQLRSPWPVLDIPQSDFDLMHHWYDVVEPKMAQTLPDAVCPYIWLDRSVHTVRPEDCLLSQEQSYTFADFTSGWHFPDDSNFEKWCREMTSKGAEATRGSQSEAGSPLAPAQHCAASLSDNAVIRCRSVGRIPSKETCTEAQPRQVMRSASAMGLLQSPETSGVQVQCAEIGCGSAVRNLPVFAGFKRAELPVFGKFGSK